MQRDPAERDREQREGELGGKEQGRRTQPARGFPEQDGERIEIRHAQQAEGHFLFFLADRRGEVADAGEQDEDQIDKNDGFEKAQAGSVGPAAVGLSEQEKEDDADEAGAGEVGELEAAILAQRADEEGEQR